MLAGRPASPMAPRQAGWPQAIGAVTKWRDAARVGLQAAFAAARGTSRGAHAAKDAVEAKTEAAVEKVAHIAHVPANVAREVRLELDAWGRGVAKRVAIGLAVGVLALVAFVVITVGVVVLLNRIAGDPYGTLIVGAFYVMAAFVGLALMARASGKAEREAEMHDERAQAAVTLDPPPAELVREQAARRDVKA